MSTTPNQASSLPCGGNAEVVNLLHEYQPHVCVDVLFFWGEVPELADWARLEIVCTPNKGTEGSNPSLSVSGDS